MTQTFKTMTFFQKSIRNIQDYCLDFQSKDLFTISINGEEIKLPLEVAITISPIVKASLIQDTTNRCITLTIDIKSNETIEYFYHLISDPQYKIPTDANFFS